MAEDTNYFLHRPTGQRYDPWTQKSVSALRDQAGEGWPDLRNKIAQARSGAAAPPIVGDIPGYAGGEQEDKRLWEWLLKSLLEGGPPEGYSGKGRVSSPVDIDYPDGLPGRAGGGYTNQ